MTEVAQATVTIIPNMKGSQATISKELGASADSAGEKAGLSIGKNLVGTLTKVVAAAGVGKIISDTINAGADLQQSFGGLETLYGDAADAAKEYAYEAAAAGISANDYAEQAVSFGASLKEAFSGDTEKAVEAANTAIMDMTDNAAKMGTPIESIQNAYQGFAKGQYNMLDNLKLGYGGTKSEMERLLKDAQEFSGVEYDIDNLGDVYEAIHVIQENLGLTGVAAEEAATTFSGSFGAMKAAAANVMANLALGENIWPHLRTLESTIKTFLVGNLIPMIGNIVKMIPGLIAEIPAFLAELLPDLIPAIGDMVAGLGNALVDAAPVFVTSMGQLFSSVWNAVTSIDWPGVANSFLTGLSEAVGGIWDSVTELLSVNFGIELPDWETVVQDITELWENIKSNITEFFTAAFDIIFDDDKTITEKISALWDLVKAGIGDFFKTTFELALPAFETIVSAISEWWGSNIWPSVQDFFKATFGLELPNWDTISQTISEGWETIKADVAAIFNVIFGVEMPSFSDIVSAVTKLWGDVWEGIANFFKVTFNVDIPTWEDIKESISQLWEDIKAGIAGFFKVKFGITLPKWSSVQEKIESGWKEVKEGVGSIFSWVFSLGMPDISGIVEDLKAWWGKIVDGIGDFFTLKWILDDGSSAEDAAQTIVDEHGGISYGGKIDIGGDQVNVDSEAIQEALSSANLTLADVDTSSIDAAREAVVNAVKDMESAFTNAGFKLPTVGTTALSAVSLILNAFISTWKNKMKFSWTLPTPHGYLPSFSVTMKEAGDGTTKTSYPVFSKSLQWFAKGGIFDAPTVIGVGDAPSPEAVVPLDMMWRQMGKELDEHAQSGNSFYFTINESANAERTAHEVAYILKQELRMA